MTLGYEIPQGSKLHFGLSARIKRDIEQKAVEIFYQNGFEEIATPIFSFAHNDALRRKIIRISAEHNNQMILRSDNTTDVIKIIHRHLGGKTLHKKWFYIQPSFSYPSTQSEQIGAESLDKDSLGSVLCVAVEIFNALGVEPTLQIANMNIPRLCAKEGNCNIEMFAKMRIDKILKGAAYLSDLLKIQTKSDLEAYIPRAPAFLRDELEILLSASFCYYENTIFSPLYYAPNGYYDGLFFRAFKDNRIFALGGRYEIDEKCSCGFAIYTNAVIEDILSQRGAK